MIKKRGGISRSTQITPITQNNPNTLQYLYSHLPPYMLS